MIYLRSALIGVGGAVLAAILWIIVAFVLPIFVPYAMRHITARITGQGVGASGAQITSNSVLIAALIGFIVAFAWEWSRLRPA